MAKIVIDAICNDAIIEGVPISGVNLQLAKNIYNYLLQVISADQIVMTRADSLVCPLSLESRLALANQSDVQLIVSVGVDSVVDTTVNGFEVIRGASAGAESVSNGIVQNATNLMTKWGLALKGISISSTLSMIINTAAPSVMVMPGFYSNAHDFNIVINYDFQKEFGFAVAQAIATYLGLGIIEFTPSTTPTPAPTEVGKVSALPLIIAGAAIAGLIAAIFLSKKK